MIGSSAATPSPAHPATPPSSFPPRAGPSTRAYVHMAKAAAGELRAAAPGLQSTGPTAAAHGDFPKALDAEPGPSRGNARPLGDVAPQAGFRTRPASTATSAPMSLVHPSRVGPPRA